MEPDIWVQSVFRKKYADDDIVVVADCRFPNEAIFGRENGILIHVDRDTKLEEDTHVSETALDDYRDYHYRVSNNGSFMELEEQLRQILRAEGLLL